ncbi:MAG: ATP-binding protein [Bacteriovoracaceae bacterium]|nr:ATP-binding protein [Bacteriovoracaceae bacterium]
MAHQEPKSKEFLEKEIIRLKKVNEALMDRVERGLGNKSPFSLFEKNVHLSTLVKERTLELEKMTTELENEKNKLSGIIQALPGAIFFFNNTFTVDRYFTTFLEQQFDIQEGIPLEKAIGNNFFDLVKKQVTRLSQNQEVVFFDFLSVSNDLERYYNCSVSSRNKGQFVLYIQDNTEKYLQEKLIKAQEGKILQSSKLASLGEMAAGVAHEINNPLAIINVSANMLKKLLVRNKIQIPAIETCVNNIEGTVSRISKIITVMRAISREPMEFRKEEVPLMDLIHDVFALCGERFKNNEVDLRLKIPDVGLGPTLYCDRVQLSQVLLNLLNNAYDATEGTHNRWIEVQYFEDSSYDMLSVKNSGKKISLDIIPKIFNPFFTTKEVGKGTGLGLSISKSILERHEGNIELRPESENTCFVLKLPKKSLNDHS